MKHAARVVLLAGCAVLSGCAAQSCRQDACEDIADEFRRVLDSASYACARDGECALYPVLVNCGGVTDRATADRLARLHEEYRGHGCPRSIRCAPRLAETAACVEGRCTGRSLRHGR